MTYMKGLFDDWQAKGITSVLHEKKGGYANNTAAIYGLAKKAEAEDVRLATGVKVTGFKKDASGAVKTVVTDRGNIDCDMVIVGAGPWVKQIWDMLGLPAAISIKGRDGKMHDNLPMWIFWSLQEGTLGVDPKLQRTNDGKMPPVIHVDTDAPLYSDVDGSLITDKLWGIYYKPDFNFGGVQGGAMPFKVKADPASVKIDPYGPESPDFVVGDDFAHMWCSALAFCQKRFEGKIGVYKKEPSGGIGSFTADSFPVFDSFCENVYVIADSNHGYKMIGVGKLVADDICGNHSDLLDPFRFSRFAEGKLHPVSNSPFPWS
jgi:glycine/D-amino acid oxidase-like deaminating enzyme